MLWELAQFCFTQLWVPGHFSIWDLGIQAQQLFLKVYFFLFSINDKKIDY